MNLLLLFWTTYSFLLLKSNAQVIAKLKTHWDMPPTSLQILEFLSDIKSPIDWVQELYPLGFFKKENTPKETYELASKLISNPDYIRYKSLFQLSMATYATSAKLQASKQFYTSTVLVEKIQEEGFNPNCSIWIDWNHVQYCDLEEFKKEFKRGMAYTCDLVSCALYSFDHVYPASSINSREASTCFLYLDILQDFMPWLSHLKSLANNQDCTLVLRFIYPSTGIPLILNGYGVELAIKSTEYKVVDDRQVKDKVESDSTDATNSDELHLLQEPEPSIQKLNSNQISQLSASVLYYINHQKDPLLALERVLQDFPKYAHLISGSTSIKEEVRDPKYTNTSSKTPSINDIQVELKENLDFVQTSTLWLNGIPLESEKLNIFELLKLMSREGNVLWKLGELGIHKANRLELVSLELSTEGLSDIPWGEAYKIQSDSIIWWNDIEKDSKYSQLPRNIYNLMMPSYPGDFKYIRRNLYSCVFFLDVTQEFDQQLLTKIFSFIQNGIPIRFGFVPMVDSDSGSTVSKIANTLHTMYGQKGGLKKCRQWIEKIWSFNGDLKRINDLITSTLASSSSAESSSTDSDKLENLYQTIHEFQNQFQISPTQGAIFANGKYIPKDAQWANGLLATYFEMMDYLVKLLSSGVIKGESRDFYEFFLSLPNVLESRDSVIFSSDPVFVDYSFVESLRWLNAHESHSLDDKNSLSPSLMIISDFTNIQGWNLVSDVLNWMKSNKNSPNLCLIHNPSTPSESIHLDILLQFHVYSNASSALSSLISILTSHTPDSFTKYLQEVAQSSEFQAFVNSKRMESIYKNFQQFKSRILPGKSSLYLNGRLVDSFSSIPTLKQVQVFLGYETSTRLGSLVTYLGGCIKDLPHVEDGSALLLQVSSLLYPLSSSKNHVFNHNVNKRVPIDFFKKLKTRNSLRVERDMALYHFVAVLDPLEDISQKLVSLLNVLGTYQDVELEIHFMSRTGLNLEKNPIQRFYRLVLSPELSFNLDGNVKSRSASFKNLPSSLFTLGMDVPIPWVIRPLHAVNDLDNIRIDNVKGTIDAEYALENILIQGHAMHSKTHEPPRGLQFTLGTLNQTLTDTITMANLGYLQLKANPGVWDVLIRTGRGRELYEFTSLGEQGTGLLLQDVGVRLVLDGFQGLVFYPIVQKRIGKESEELLVTLGSKDKNKQEEEDGVWKNVKDFMFGSSSSDSPHKNSNKNSLQKKTINIFSVASGHLYERFLSIMMISVVKQTKHFVKFWLIENFLSPSFMKFIPFLSQEYGFEYEFVTYKWPHWLRAQKEKQRTIWGYKILFLDVLFPLDLEQVIFVDADQVVRTDLIELVELDLHGAVYGYTPMCDSRKEMEGFRFWKQGYWKNHLGGKPYHISALYVIDLVRFRQLAAGDRLRQQYQGLSADPNSLANLDQDLPNNMIHQLPIYSLPQDWLWCETWCSDESLKTAKTIDLCNNPMTKEPKLDRAKRQLPEWVGLDEEARASRERFENGLDPLSLALHKGSPQDSQDSHLDL